MLKQDVPYAVSSCCFIHHIYIDAWHHSLSVLIRNASRNFADCISCYYRTEGRKGEYQIFSACGEGYWMIGVGIHIPDTFYIQYPTFLISGRRIGPQHCIGNIALIIEHELGKMPVALINRH